MGAALSNFSTCGGQQLMGKLNPCRAALRPTDDHYSLCTSWQLSFLVPVQADRLPAACGGQADPCCQTMFTNSVHVSPVTWCFDQALHALLVLTTRRHPLSKLQESSNGSQTAENLQIACLGFHKLPIEQGPLQLPRHRQVCTLCHSGHLGYERHLLLKCPAI